MINRIIKYFSKTDETKKKEILKIIQDKDWKKLNNDNFSNLHLLDVEDTELMIKNLLDDNETTILINHNIMKYYIDYDKESNIEFMKRFLLLLSDDEILDFIDANVYNMFLIFIVNKHNEEIFNSFISKINMYSYGWSFIDHKDYTIPFYLYMKEHLSYESFYLWNHFISQLDTEKIKEVYSIEEFTTLLDMNEIINWNDIILDYVIEDGDIIKYLSAFKKNINISKIIELIDEFDCDNIINYNLMIQIIKCQESDISVKLLEKTNLTTTEKRDLLKLSPSCSI